MAKKARKSRKAKRHSAVRKIKKALRHPFNRGKTSSKAHRTPSTERTEAKKPAVLIEFCDKCGSILVPVKKRENTYLKCRRCGAEKKRDIKALKIVEPAKKRKGVTILEKDTTPLPMVEMRCEKCNNTHAYFWLQQTRSADEPPTQFFRCTKCKYTWREYK